MITGLALTPRAGGRCQKNEQDSWVSLNKHSTPEQPLLLYFSRGTSIGASCWPRKCRNLKSLEQSRCFTRSLLLVFTPIGLDLSAMGIDSGREAPIGEVKVLSTALVSFLLYIREQVTQAVLTLVMAKVGVPLKHSLEFMFQVTGACVLLEMKN